MKKALLALSATVGLLSFTTLIDGNYKITGSAQGIKDGEKVFLERRDDKGFVAVDSAKVESGKFVLAGNAVELSIHYVKIGSSNEKISVVLEKGNIDILVYKDSITKSKISGTPNNVELEGFNVSMRKYQKRIQDFQILNNKKMTDAKTNNDQVTIDRLMQEYNDIQQEMMVFTDNYALTHPKAYISVLIINNMFGNQKNDIEKIKKAFNALDPSVKNTIKGKEVSTKIANYRLVEVGKVTPDFTAPDTEGKKVSLKSSLGKITVLDFWASWCGPCRKENPNMVALYNEFHSKGLNILGVSLDKDATKWKDAIAKDNLTWTHVSNLKFWQEPIAEMYGVKSVPATFILDAKGKIIAKDLRGEELKAKIAELLVK